MDVSTELQGQSEVTKTTQVRRAPMNSLVYERLLPIIFITLGLILLALLLFAVGVLLGFVRYQ